MCQERNQNDIILSGTQEPQGGHKCTCWRIEAYIVVAWMNEVGWCPWAAIWISESRSARSGQHFCSCHHKSGKAKVLMKDVMVSHGSRGRSRREFNVIHSLQRPVQNIFRKWNTGAKETHFGIYDYFFFFFFWLCWVFVSVRGLSPVLRQVGATLHRGAWASHYRGLSCCGAQAPDAQAQ